MQQTTANCSASCLQRERVLRSKLSLSHYRLLRFLARTRSFSIVVYLSFYVFMFSLLYILLTHTFAYTAAFNARSCALSHSHFLLGVQQPARGWSAFVTLLSHCNAHVFFRCTFLLLHAPLARLVLYFLHSPIRYIQHRSNDATSALAMASAFWQQQIKCLYAIY